MSNEQSILRLLDETLGSWVRKSAQDLSDEAGTQAATLIVGAKLLISSVIKSGHTEATIPYNDVTIDGNGEYGDWVVAVRQVSKPTL